MWNISHGSLCSVTVHFFSKLLFVTVLVSKLWWYVTYTFSTWLWSSLSAPYRNQWRGGVQNCSCNVPHGESSWAVLLPQLALLLLLLLAPEGAATATTQIILHSHLLYSIICSRLKVLGPVNWLRLDYLLALWFPGCWERDYLTLLNFHSRRQDSVFYLSLDFSPHSRGFQRSIWGQFGLHDLLKGYKLLLAGLHPMSSGS